MSTDLFHIIERTADAGDFVLLEDGAWVGVEVLDDPASSWRPWSGPAAKASARIRTQPARKGSMYFARAAAGDAAESVEAVPAWDALFPGGRA